MFDQFKLFGRRIAVPEPPAAEEAGDALESPKLAAGSDPEKDPCQEAISAEVKDLVQDATEGFDCNDVEGASGIDVTKDPSDKETSADDELMVELKPEKGHTLAGQEKVKKPDKILPCPRCSSMDTKFCYYNNYNVNQPRHFCKKCQRYWTAGGTMRNVPVGAGRRKNKHSSASYRHVMTVTEGMPLSQVDGPESPHCHSTLQFNANRMVLKFGQEAQICDSIANSLNLTEQKRQDDVSTTLCGENVKGPTSSSSLPCSTSLEKGTLENAAHVKQSALPDSCSGLIPMCPPQCYSSTPWAFHWSSNWNDATTASGKSVSAVTNVHETGNLNPIAWPLPPMMAPSSFIGPTIPISFIPASFWGCMASWPASSWSTLSIGPTGSPVLSPSSENSECLGIHSPRLGKHSRDSIQQVEEKVEKSLWVPKTLRIDDPEEAAKSSIWATLGIKHVQNDAHVKGGIFKSFQPDTNERSLQPDTHVMHANPAALSRSQTFQESS